jgi:hypothetical protein
LIESLLIIIAVLTLLVCVPPAIESCIDLVDYLKKRRDREKRIAQEGQVGPSDTGVVGDVADSTSERDDQSGEGVA